MIIADLNAFSEMKHARSVVYNGRVLSKQWRCGDASRRWITAPAHVVINSGSAVYVVHARIGVITGIDFTQCRTRPENTNTGIQSGRRTHP